MNARNSWWIGRFWILVGWWLVASGVTWVFWLEAVVAPRSQHLAPILQGILLVAGGLASLWAGRQRLARAIEPDSESIERLCGRLLHVLMWGLGVIGGLVAILVLAWPSINSALVVHFVRSTSTVAELDQVRHIRGRDAGWTAVLAGRLDAGHVDRFIAVNTLLPDPAAENLRYMASSRQLQEWEKQWPNDPEWYSRRWQRPNDTCRLGCYILCLVDRRSGGVWVAVEEPDLAGD